MIQVNHLGALLYKDFLDTLKNMQVLILFIVFPVVGFVMSTSIETESAFFIATFATMHFVFTPIVAASSMVAEEKERNTLRVLSMSGISSIEFFVSKALFILLLEGITGCSFLGMGMQHIAANQLIIAGLIGCMVSIIIGMSIGAYAQSGSAANGIAIPIGMLFAFLPMLASFNESIRKVSQYLYGQQVNNLISGSMVTIKVLIICVLNLVVVLCVYNVLYKRIKHNA